MANREDERDRIEDLPAPEAGVDQAETVRGGDGQTAGDSTGPLPGLVSGTNMDKPKFKTSTTTITTSGEPLKKQ